MAKEPGLFLERRTYRRNRLYDAARLLPVLGLVLLFGPIFIRDTDAAPVLSGGLVYYMVVWAILIVLTAIVSAALVRSDPTADTATTKNSHSDTAPHRTERR